MIAAAFSGSVTAAEASSAASSSGLSDPAQQTGPCGMSVESGDIYISVTDVEVVCSGGGSRGGKGNPFEM